MSPVSCPQCGREAHIYDRFTLGSTSGVIEHAKTRCPEGHWFTVPEERLRPYRPAHTSGQHRAAAAVPVLAARLGLL